MRDPTKLRVTAGAEDIAVMTYRATRPFPSAERYGIVLQMRKAAISIGSNISEGCGYSSDRAFLSYLHQSLGSAHELEFQCRVSIKLALGNSTKLTELLARI